MTKSAKLRRDRQGRWVPSNGKPDGWKSAHDCGWRDYSYEDPTSMRSIDRDYPDMLLMYVGMIGGAPLEEIAELGTRRSQSTMISNVELPLNCSPGYRERYHGEETVVLEGAEERLEIMKGWLEHPECDDWTKGCLTYQIEALTKDIECARVWKAWGVEFGEPVNKLMRKAKLPEGWKIVRTDHYMYSNLVDEKGRKRVQIGLKWEDRWASMIIFRRFSIRQVYLSEKDGKHDRDYIVYHVLDGDKEIHRPEPVHFPEPNLVGPPFKAWLDTREAREREVVEECCTWLAERYPNFRDPTAHWDDP